MTPPDPIDDWLPAILDRARLGEVRTFERLTGGAVNHVYRVNGDLVVRIGTGSDGKEFPKSAAVMRAVEGTVKAPLVLHTDFSLSLVPYNVMVYTYVEGELLSKAWPGLTREEQRRTFHAVVRELDAMHRVPAQNLPCLNGKPSWQEELLGSIVENLYLARQANAFPADRLDRMEAYVERNRGSLEAAPPPVLLHWDAHWGNVLIRGGELAALVDFDDAALAPAEVDLLCLILNATEYGGPEEIEARNWLDEACSGLFGTPGLKERFGLFTVDEILWGLTQAHTATWTSASQGRADAEESYTRLFENGDFDAWFE